MVRLNLRPDARTNMSALAETLQTAVQHHQAGALDLAESLYREIIRIDPQHADALHLLGVAAHQKTNHKSAVEFIRRAIAINSSTALYHSNLGACYRKLGQFEDACASFREAIRISPRFAGAHYNLGLVLQAKGEFDEAIGSYRAAIQLEPDFLDAWNNLGNTLLAVGRIQEAIDSYRSILELAPDAADIHYNLAGALEQCGDLPAAELSYRDALRFQPGMAEAFNNLGAVLKRLGRSEEAIACFDKAIALRPGYTDAELNRAAVLQSRLSLHTGVVDPVIIQTSSNPAATAAVAQGQACERSGRIAEAKTHFRQAIALDPNIAAAHFGLGFALLSEGNHVEARACYEMGLALDVRNCAAWLNLGTIQYTLGDAAEAVRCYRRAIEIEPRNAKGHFNLGNIHKDFWELDHAIGCYDRAIELDPQLAEAHLNLGVVYQHLGQLDKALASHDCALQIRPRDAETRFHRSQTRLMRGDFTAWDEYEARWEYEAAARILPQSAWDGSPIGDKSLFIHAEQGVGDEIMFASCVPDVIGHARRCCIEVDRRLVGLFARSFPLATVVARPASKSSPIDPAASACDLQIAMASLPRIVRRTEASFPRLRRYLVPNATQLQTWQARLRALGSGLKVGISWRGGHSASIRQRRSIALENLTPVLQVPGVHFFNLQYGDCADELSQYRQSAAIQLHSWNDFDPIQDLESFAAQIAALDLVISVDNSTVHFAGALGTPVWTLLHSSPNWRWMLERSDSVWYSSVRLFRQPSLGDWNSVIARVQSELSSAVQAGHVTMPVPSVPRQNVKEIAPAAIETTVPSEVSSACAQPAGARVFDSETLREKEKYEKAWSHQEYRRMSPGLVALESLPLVDMLRKHQVRTILDAGCGSGKMMQRLMTEFGSEFDVHGFDLSENCLDPFFDGIRDKILTIGCLWNPDDFQKQYDGVMCTDVLEHIPPQHVAAVLANLRKSTRKLAYLSISVQSDLFGPRFLGEPLHLTVRKPNWWFAQLTLAGFKITAHAMANDKYGEAAQLHVFLTV